MGLPTLCLVKEGLIEEGLVKEGLIEESLVKRQSGPRGSVEFARVGTDGTRRLGGLVLLFAIGASAPLAAAEWRHGLSFFGEFKYDAGFQYFDYVQPDAPQGGGFVIPSFGNFDSVNPFIRKGRKATGMDYTTALIYERLMFKADDEPSSQYGWLAESVLLADDLKSITRVGGMLKAKPKGGRSRWSG